jgi:hypothetical protein
VTDYFVTAETGLLTLLKTELTSFFPNGDKQVTASDDTVYDNGNDFYATTYPGAFPVTDRASTHLIYEWELLLDLLAKWKTTESRAWNENGFKALRSAVVNLINHTEKGRTLGKTLFIKSAVISAEDRPRYIPLKTGDPNNLIVSHIGQVCIVTVTMHVPRAS